MFNFLEWFGVVFLVLIVSTIIFIFAWFWELKIVYMYEEKRQEIMRKMAEKMVKNKKNNLDWMKKFWNLLKKIDFQEKICDCCSNRDYYSGECIMEKKSCETENNWYKLKEELPVAIATGKIEEIFLKI